VILLVLARYYALLYGLAMLSSIYSAAHRSEGQANLRLSCGFAHKREGSIAAGKDDVLVPLASGTGAAEWRRS
jgi:hypothetical protein